MKDKFSLAHNMLNEKDHSAALAPRVKEAAWLERHDETFENESRVCAAKRNSHVESDTMPKEFSVAPGRSA